MRYRHFAGAGLQMDWPGRQSQLRRPPGLATAGGKQSNRQQYGRSDDLPYELAEARKNAPVTLYTGQKCIVCDEGRKLLTARGVPFTEKTVVTNADIASFGGTQVELPQLTVGAAKLSGLDPTAWQSRLTAAGYPESNKLPKNYRNPPATSAGPAEAPKTGAENGGGTGKPATVLRPPKPAPARAAESAVPGLRF